MNLYNNLFVFILLFEAVTLSVCDIVCGPGDTYLPNPVNCGSFYQCSNGIPIPLDCPPPLVFSPILNVCVWSYDYDCQISTTEDISTIITEPTSPATELSSPTTEPPSPITTSSPTTEFPSPEPPANTCDVICSPSNEDLPNPCDCNSFYKCTNGVPELFDCAATHEGEPSLVFDPISGECVYPHEYDCQISTTKGPSTITMTVEPATESTSTTSELSSTTVESSSPTTESSPTAEPTFTVTQSTSSTTVISSSTVASSTVSSSPSTESSSPSTEPSSPTIQPPANVCKVVCGAIDENVPNPCDCNSFYKCANGVPELFDCAATHEGEPSLVFDPISGECVYPHEYDCQISTTKGPSTITMTVEPATESTSTTSELSSTTVESSSPTTESSPTAEPTFTVTQSTSSTTVISSSTVASSTESSSPSTESSSPSTESSSPSTEPSSPTIQPPANVCKVVCGATDENVPNPCDCNSFYKCANGVPELFDCAATHEGEPSLVFDPISGECVYPHEYDCQISTTKGPSTITMTVEPATESTSTTSELSSTTVESSSPTTESSPTAEPTFTVTQSTSSTTVISSSTVASSTESSSPSTESSSPSTESSSPSSPTIQPPANVCKVVCGPTDENIPNPCDCNSFYKCANGVPELFDCAATHEGEPALVFSPTENQCVWPNEYDCKVLHPCHEFDHPISCLHPSNIYNCSFCFDGCFPNSSRCDTYKNLHQAGCQSFSLDESDYDSIVNTSTNCSTWVPIEPGRKRNISVIFSLKKHPLDLYYLMDFSGSMQDDKVKLISLSSALLYTLTNLTNDFHIGFGTFVDKPTPPFGGIGDYSFHHTLPLTSLTGDFVERIENTPILYGRDAPEAHGDALAQVVECVERIGWRENARKVVLLATDIDFHIAGDGALGGITDPYVDGCYLDTQGFYSEELTMDYPSVEQIARAYSKNQAVTTVIFATDVGSIDFYENVASQFRSAYVAVLNSDSSNIIDLLGDEFAKINSRMEIEKSDTSDTVYFRYYSSCMGSGGDKETAICENLPASGEVTFIVEIDMPECPIDKSETGMIIDFNPVGLPISIELELSFLCD